MSVTGTIAVTCPACGTSHEAKLVQSINARTEPDAKRRLLAGELNVVDCACGARTQLAATIVYADPDREYLAQVCPGDDIAMKKAAEVFRVAGSSGTQRLVPSLNALVEKVKLLDAGLLDWAVEMTKVLLLASLGEPDFDRVLLFAGADPQLLHWLLFDEEGLAPEPVSSPRSAYDKLAARTQGRPAAGELRIDRVWAVEAVRRMIAEAN